MRNLLHCRRGSVAFATVIALVPLIGVVALGAEAGSWYVIHKHAQNAADSAALSGALAIANANTQPNFGTLNGFSSTDVTISQGSYSTGTGFVPGGVPANAVQAVVTQCQSQSLSLVLYTTSCKGTSKSVAISAQAVASVVTPAKLPCALALGGPITFHDNGVSVNAPKCSIASNVPDPPASQIGIDLSHTPSPFNVGGLSTSGSCSGSACSTMSPPVMTYAPPVTNPFATLTSAMTSPSTLTLPNSCATLLPYTASNPCSNSFKGSQKSSPNAITQSGVYFFSDLTLSGGGSLFTCKTGDPAPCTGPVSATIILLPGATLTMTGNSFINITAPTTAPLASQLPAQLASDTIRNLLVDMAIFDTETSPKIGGTSTLSGSGVFYLPNADPLNFQGNPTSASSTCTEVIAKSIQFSGSSNYLDNSGCPTSIVPKSQFVALVQ